jgi:acetylornithine/N-succinyldiaminopimelate aminotransferase
MSSAVAQGSALLPAYARQDVKFVSGEGSWLVDDEGRRYLDLVAGIAVVGLGHLHPAPLTAARAQLERLWHTSNLYSTEPGEQLAARLSERFGGAQAFFCNSGTEAVEAAIKYARKATGKPGIVALNGSFHGRTLGALSATGQPAKQAPFEPLVPGVRFAEPNDVESLRAAAEREIGRPIGCIVLEPILGEGGIRPLTPEFVAAARELADQAGALLVLDEVQTGMGRTGTFFCWEQLGVKPDLATLAKGLANGLPIGALLVADGAPTGLVPGDHGSTFGGNPVACAAAVAVVDAITAELLDGVRAKEALVRSAFPSARGRGLLIGVELDRPAGPVVDACRERGVLVGSAGERVLRLTPPLTIPEADLAHGLHVLEEVLSDG